MVLNPITPHGSVVVNAAYDYCHYTKATSGPNGDLDPGVHHIQKKDLVFTDLKDSKRKRSSYNEPDLHVFASTNGVSDERRTPDNYAFIGVSNTHLDAGSHSHAAVTVAGLITIKNTGTSAIVAGDTVVWTLADHDSERTRRKVFRTMPYKDAFQFEAKSHIDEVAKIIEMGEPPKMSSVDPSKLSADAFKRALKKIRDEKTFHNDSEVLKALAPFLKCYAYSASQANSRIVGTALSKCEEGGDFDILLRHSH